MEVATQAKLTCPQCGVTTAAEMPTEACQYFYDCPSCGTLLKPHSGDCCVFCSYADRRCPPKQIEAATK